jgi:hypothetical protein
MTMGDEIRTTITVPAGQRVYHRSIVLIDEETGRMGLATDGPGTGRAVFYDGPTFTAKEDTKVEVISEGEITLETVRVAGVPSKEACDMVAKEVEQRALEKAWVAKHGMPTCDRGEMRTQADAFAEVAAYLRSLHGEGEET